MPRRHGAAALLLAYEREAMHELCKQSPREPEDAAAFNNMRKK
jgi:hypothetical protein